MDHASFRGRPDVIPSVATCIDRIGFPFFLIPIDEVLKSIQTLSIDQSVQHIRVNLDSVKCVVVRGFVEFWVMW